MTTADCSENCPEIGPGETGAATFAAGLRAGAVEVLVFALPVAAYGFVCGVLSRMNGLSLLEVEALSVLLFAGTSQIVATQFWGSPEGLLAIVLAVGLINSRYFPMLASTAPHFESTPMRKRLIVAHVTVDENWALLMRAGNERDPVGFILGSGGVLLAVWVIVVTVGWFLGGSLLNPSDWGLDTIIIWVLVSLLAGIWKSGRREWVTGVVAVLVSLFWSMAFGPSVHVIISVGVACWIGGMIDEP